MPSNNSGRDATLALLALRYLTDCQAWRLADRQGVTVLYAPVSEVLPAIRANLQRMHDEIEGEDD